MPLPLSKRGIDLLIVAWFVIFFISTSFSDLHNFIASFMGVQVDALEHMNLVYPPKALTWAYFRWARSVDPLLHLNPIWWQAIEWVNMLCLTPFAMIASIAFLRGSNQIRLPAVSLIIIRSTLIALYPPSHTSALQIIISSFTLYSLIVCIGATL